jgi:oligopeptide/dipeptide ABC transporter ATP-binding protein
MTTESSPPLVEISGLAIEYLTRGGRVRALDGVDLMIRTRSSVGIVGESGSGKSTLGLAIGRMLPPGAERTAGDLRFEGQSVFELSKSALRELRRDRLGFIFQNPMTALDPTMRVRQQLERANTDLRAAGRTAKILAEVGLSNVERVAHSFPHELSGGMAQRVAIALAVTRRPPLLIADEPTASLDAMVREEVLAVLFDLKVRLGTTLVLLSHELQVIIRRCDVAAVMYGGRIVEYGAASLLFDEPRHPYTRALMQAAPGRERYGQRLEPIAGGPPTLHASALGCTFAPRCPFAIERCRMERPQERLFQGRQILCHRAEDIAELVRLAGDDR